MWFIKVRCMRAGSRRRTCAKVQQIVVVVLLHHKYFLEIIHFTGSPVQSLLESRSVHIRKEIGFNFRRVRTQRSLSLREVEAITGVDHSWLAKFEKGLINFEIDTLINLADNFDIDIRDLFVFDRT